MSGGCVMAAARRDGGVALLAVLWFVVAVSALAVVFLRLATGDRLLVATQSDAVEARALVADGLARTVVVLNGRTNKPLPSCSPGRCRKATSPSG